MKAPRRLLVEGNRHPPRPHRPARHPRHRQTHRIRRRRHPPIPRRQNRQLRIIVNMNDIAIQLGMLPAPGAPKRSWSACTNSDPASPAPEPRHIPSVRDVSSFQVRGRVHAAVLAVHPRDHIEHPKYGDLLRQAGLLPDRHQSAMQRPAVRAQRLPDRVQMCSLGAQDPADHRGPDRVQPGGVRGRSPSSPSSRPILGNAHRAVSRSHAGHPEASGSGSSNRVPIRAYRRQKGVQRLRLGVEDRPRRPRGNLHRQEHPPRPGRPR